MWLEKCTYYYEIAIGINEVECDKSCSRFIEIEEVSFNLFAVNINLSYQSQLVEYWRGQREYREYLTDAFLQKEVIFSGKFKMCSKCHILFFVFNASL